MDKKNKNIIWDLILIFVFLSIREKTICSLCFTFLDYVLFDFTFSGSIVKFSLFTPHLKNRNLTAFFMELADKNCQELKFKDMIVCVLFP